VTIPHRYETEPARLAAHSIRNHDHFVNGSIWGEEVPEIGFSSGEREISDV
jgi:hypothetical protein